MLFTVPKSTKLKINVYTILIEKVLIAEEGKYEYGSYNIEINASGLSSGIYIIKDLARHDRYKYLLCNYFNFIFYYSSISSNLI